ncbi:hypothetical protein FJ365_02490 [Candidatus Dependentiae bacterium]|nr:hypothetical protein [Candidatus Dependentiae bacterium]
MTSYLASLKALFYASPYRLIIQLSPTDIFCALASIHKQSLIIHSIEHTPCTDHEITTTSIANPTKLVKLIQTFLSHHNQPNLPLVCFSSMLQPPTNNPQHVLQHLLALSKVSGPVIGLYNNTPLTKALTSNAIIPFTSPADTSLINYITSTDSRNWHKRLRHTFLLILLPFCGTLSYVFFQKHSLNTIQQQEKRLNNYLNSLKPRVQQAKELEKQNKLLTDRIKTIQSLTTEQEIIAHASQTIAQHIPPNTWLTTIRIGHPGEASKQTGKKVIETILNSSAKTLPLQLEGKTTDPDEISKFLESLSIGLPNSTLSIQHITRAKQPKKGAQKPSPYPYNFTITGAIPTSSS